MTSRVTTVPMAVEGVTILVEVTNQGGTEKTSRLDSARDVVVGAFDRAQTAILAIASSTVSTIDGLSRQALSPEEVEVKFGLKFAAEGNVILAGASGEVNLEVSFKYVRPAHDAGTVNGT